MAPAFKGVRAAETQDYRTGLTPIYRLLSVRWLVGVDYSTGAFGRGQSRTHARLTPTQLSVSCEGLFPLGFCARLRRRISNGRQNLQGLYEASGTRTEAKWKDIHWSTCVGSSCQNQTLHITHYSIAFAFCVPSLTQTTVLF